MVLEMTRTSSGSGSGAMWRLGPNGKAITVDVNRDDYVQLKTGQYVLEFLGISEQFDMNIDPRYRKPDGPTTKKMVRVEVRVVEPRKRAGQIASELLAASLDERANLYKLAVALRGGKSIEEGETVRFKELLGGHFRSSVVMNETGTRTKISGFLPPEADEDDENEEPEPPARTATRSRVATPDDDDDLPESLR